MVKIINGKALNTWEEAVNAVYAEANSPPISLEVIDCFTFIRKSYDESELRAKAERFIDKEFKVDFTYHQRDLSWWYVPVPKVKYVKQVLPHLNFSIDLYVAVTAEFHYWSFDAMLYSKSEAKYPCSLIGKFIEDVVDFQIPLVLLKAIADCDYSQYEVVEKERFWTTLDVNGFQARLPDSFAQMIMSLHGKPLGQSLEKMKLLGTNVGTLIDKNLLTPPPMLEISVKPQGNAPDDYDKMVSCLKDKMAYTEVEAKKGAKYTMEKFPQLGLEEKIKKAVIYLGGKNE